MRKLIQLVVLTGLLAGCSSNVIQNRQITPPNMAPVNTQPVKTKDSQISKGFITIKPGDSVMMKGISSLLNKKETEKK
jgi:hypothetical protein